MTANEFLSLVSAVSGLLGIVASMAGMGLGLTIAQIAAPLKNGRLVVLMLLANFSSQRRRSVTVASSRRSKPNCGCVSPNASASG